MSRIQIQNGSFDRLFYNFGSRQIYTGKASKGSIDKKYTRDYSE
jgi:hypothetical protein